MANEIRYNTEELQQAQNILKESVNILQSEIQSPIGSDFQELTKVDLFSDGLTKLKTQVDSLITDYNSFSTSLGTHENDMSEFEDTQAAQVQQYVGSSSYHGSYSSGEHTPADKVETIDEDDGKKVTDAYLKQIIPAISYESKLQALKNILTYNTDTLTSILTDMNKANILTYQLKKMLNGQDFKLSELSTDDEKLIQKALLESICKEEKNLFAEIDDSTFLVGMPYLNKIAKENNIAVSDLILEDKYTTLLMTGLVNIYNGDAKDTLTSNEIEKVKTYLNNVASANNMDIKTLLSDEKYISLIKGGIKNESKS